MQMLPTVFILLRLNMEKITSVVVDCISTGMAMRWEIVGSHWQARDQGVWGPGGLWGDDMVRRLVPHPCHPWGGVRGKGELVGKDCEVRKWLWGWRGINRLLFQVITELCHLPAFTPALHSPALFCGRRGWDQFSIWGRDKMDWGIHRDSDMACGQRWKANS